MQTCGVQFCKGATACRTADSATSSSRSESVGAGHLACLPLSAAVLPALVPASQAGSALSTSEGNLDAGRCACSHDKTVLHHTVLGSVPCFIMLSMVHCLKVAKIL